jgi:hypothetical protein
MPQARSANLAGMRIGLAGRPFDMDVESESVKTETNQVSILEREQEAITVDEAIVSLARAVFSESGTLVFEDHPLLTPLLEEIALEYWRTPELETRRAEHEEAPNPQLLIVGHPEPYGNEQFGRIPSLMKYIQEIPETFDALIFIANQTGDFRRWRNRSARRKFIIPSTGGMASRTESSGEFIDFDNELWGITQNRRGQMPIDYHRERDELPGALQEAPELRYALYPLLMDRIIEEIIKAARG